MRPASGGARAGHAEGHLGVVGQQDPRPRGAADARKVDIALREVMTGSDLPLTLAASQPMTAAFRAVCTYPHLVADREHGSPDTTTDANLADAAPAILDEVYADELAELAQLFEERRSQGRTAATSPTSLAWPPSVPSTP